MSPRRDRVVKVRVSEQEQARWVELAKTGFEGNLSDAIRSAMERSIGEAAEWTRHNLLLDGTQLLGRAIFTTDTSTKGGTRLEYVSPSTDLNTLHCPRIVEGVAADSSRCPHGRVRESQWCPVCDREAA